MTAGEQLLRPRESSMAARWQVVPSWPLSARLAVAAALWVYYLLWPSGPKPDESMVASVVLSDVGPYAMEIDLRCREIGEAWAVAATSPSTQPHHRAQVGVVGYWTPQSRHEALARVGDLAKHLALSGAAADVQIHDVPGAAFVTATPLASSEALSGAADQWGLGRPFERATGDAVWPLVWADAAGSLRQRLVSAASPRHDAASLRRGADELASRMIHTFPGLRASIDRTTDERPLRPQARLVFHADAGWASAQLTQRVHAAIDEQRGSLPAGMGLYDEPTSDPCGDGGFVSGAWDVLVLAVMVLTTALLVGGWPRCRIAARASPSRPVTPSEEAAQGPLPLDPPLPSRHTGWPV
jgi:hypothetical protein